MAGNLIDLDELDIDTLCNSLNNIADKKTNNQKLKYLDQLYEKTIALASPRITKNKSILSQLIPSTPISTPYSYPILPSSPSSNGIWNSTEVRMCMDDLISQIERNESTLINNNNNINKNNCIDANIMNTNDYNTQNETYKIKYDTLLIYVKKLQNQQKSYENKVKELKYECEYALHAFDIVSAEYEMLKKENELSKSLVETNENFSNKIIELVKENRKLKDEKQDLLNLINEGVLIEEAGLNISTKYEMREELKELVKDKMATFVSIKKK